MTDPVIVTDLYWAVGVLLLAPRFPNAALVFGFFLILSSAVVNLVERFFL